MPHIATKNPFGDGAGGDGPMEKGGNDFTKNPAPQAAPPGVGNDFTKNPGGFNGQQAGATPAGPDAASIPSGGRMPFGGMPAFSGAKGGSGAKPTPHFKLKG